MTSFQVFLSVQQKHGKRMNEMIQRPEYKLGTNEFRQGLVRGYGDKGDANLVRVYSDSDGVKIAINQSLADAAPSTEAVLGSLVKVILTASEAQAEEAKQIKKLGRCSINTMKHVVIIILSFSFHQLSAQPVRLSLTEFSNQMNGEFPQIFDHATRLVSSSVENSNFIYHFQLRADQIEFRSALPHVKAQILKTVCGKPKDKILLTVYKANLVYKYENDKGNYLGEFMVRPEHCFPK